MEACDGMEAWVGIEAWDGMEAWDRMEAWDVGCVTNPRILTDCNLGGCSALVK